VDTEVDEAVEAEDTMMAGDTQVVVDTAAGTRYFGE